MTASVDGAPDLSGLIALSKVEHLDLKPVILRVQTDLFVQAALRDRPAAESFEVLACGLIPTVDAETAAIVARKLAPCPDTPESILVRLVEHGGEARDIVVSQVRRLTPALMEAASADGADLGAVVAARPDLSRSVMVELARRNEPEIDLALASNTGSLLTGETLHLLVGRARSHYDLAMVLLGRPDLPPADLSPLFLSAHGERRDAIAEAVAATAALRPCPPAQRDIGPILTGLSAARDVSGFVKALGDALGLPSTFLAGTPDPATRYELLTLALRAADLHEEEAVYVFLTLNEAVARSAERVFELVRLFRTTARGAARDLLSAILDTPLAERAASEAAHQPYAAPDSKSRAGAAEQRLPARPPLPLRMRRTS